MNICNFTFCILPFYCPPTDLGPMLTLLAIIGFDAVLKPKKTHKYIFFLILGAYVLQVKATDADDPTYGSSARVVYSILQGQPYFSIDPKTGMIIL